MVETPENARRILLFSSPNLGRSVAALLQARGYVVHRTPSLSGGRDLVRRLDPGLVILAFDQGWTQDRDDVRAIEGLHPRPPVLRIGAGKASLPRSASPTSGEPGAPQDIQTLIDRLLAAAQS